MKSATASIIASIALAVGALWSTPAQAAVTLICEQGAPGSWKMCEAQPEGQPTYVWSVSGGGILDPYVCTSNSNICTAFCKQGSRSGYLNVSVYNSSNQLIGSASKSLGCVSGS